MLATALFAPVRPASAQSHPPSDQLVEQMTQRARAALPAARLEDGSYVPAETPQQLAQPIIPRTVEIATIRRGELSGQMARCGLEWQNESFLPFMQQLRADGWRGKKMAYVGLLHGITLGATLGVLQDTENGCDAADVAAMSREASALVDLP